MKRVSIFTSLVSLLTIALILMGSGAYAEEYIGDSGHAQTEVDTDARSSEGIQSLNGSFVEFDDSVGSDICNIAGVPQASCLQATPLTTWMDNFDSYATGSQLHGQGGWKGWFNDPSGGALTSNAQANSAPNSAAILGASDLVHEYFGYTSGAWVYKAMQFVPYGFVGQSYFILLNSYNDAGSNLNWSVQVLFNGTSNEVSNDGASGGTLPLIRGNWVELRVEIDLDADTQAFYYNNQLLYAGTWTSEVTGGGVLNIGAVDLFANSASVIYYDDMSLAPLPGPIVDAWKEAPDFAEPGEVITYTITIEAEMLMDGMYMVDPLPDGVEYAGNLTWSNGEAWYDAGDNTVYWEYAGLMTAGEPATPPQGVYDPDAVADLVGAVEPSDALLAEGDVKTFSYPLSVLWDNGPQVTDHGGGYNNHAASALQSSIGLNTYGFGNQFALGYRMADDFEITDPNGWWIDTVTFFAYQTATYPYPPPSTITGIYFQIWNGPPNDPGSSIVWGDLVTNRLVETAWSEIYRVIDTAMLNTQRPTMANIAEAGLWLPPGTYWLDWTTDGSGASGPWAPPVTILGETTTGNAMQYTTAWAFAVDTGLGTPQGMPFIIAGKIGSVLVEISFDVTITGVHGDIILNEALAGLSGNDLAFAATTAVVGIPAINIDPLELHAEVVIDKSAVKTLSICNAGTAPLEWDLIIAADPIMMSVLIIQDQYPWGYSSIQDILTAKGIAYDQIDSSQIPAVDLSPYALVIIPANQPGDFYTTWNDNLAKFESFVENGGALWLSTAAYSWTVPEPLLPGGVINSTDLDDYNDIVEPTHPWVAGVPDPMYGFYASHDSFTNLYPGSLVVARAQTSQNPTLVDYSLGDGRILITGQTLEIAWMINWDAAPILKYSLLDMYYWAVASDIPWLSEDANTGELLPGECQEVKMTFDTTGMDLGNYSANLLLFSNDPLNPISVVPVELIVVEPVEFFIYLPVALKN